MNKAITEGVIFMPPAFADGLAVWSSEDGRPGTDTYDNAANAAVVTADQDFGGCIELQKTEGTQRLRYMGETPLLPGCYLRIKARVKAISGALPTLRIAGFAARSNGSAVPGLTTTGPETELTSYGSVVEIDAIVGPGARGGVDLAWGTEPVYGHFGLDLTGPNGGLVRIDDLSIEDVTSVFITDMMGSVDVRDYGAIGDALTDSSAAFEAADTAANGREVFVPAGVYRLDDDVTINSRIRFEGNVEMPRSRILSLTKNFDLSTYIDAFGDEELAFKKAFQALLNNSDHEGLDLGGRRLTIDGPIDMADAVANKTSYAQRRHIRNGQFFINSGSNWDPDVFTSPATYTASDEFTLRDVDNVANIPIGSLVTGAGVGREIYVREKNVGAGEITLSQPLYSSTGRQTFTFTRFKYVLDFSGFDRLDLFSLSDIEINCREEASGVMLARSGVACQMRDCMITRPGHRGISSPGYGCQGLLVDRCQFISKEGGVPTGDRETIALNANANDVKLRNNRATQFRHFAILSGAHNIVSGNHFFQGGTANGPRTAGLVLTLRSCNTTVVGNYIDNCMIEWTNEREPEPDFTGGFGFAGLSITNNIFLCSQVLTSFSPIIVKPFGTGHRINGMAVTGNLFRVVQATIERVERVDTTFADLDFGAMRSVDFSNNTYHNVEYGTSNPVVITHDQNTASATWTVSGENFLAFGGRAREVDAIAPRGRIQDGNGDTVYAMPYTQLEQGSEAQDVRLRWPEAVRGEMRVTMRMDR
ncbi:glycosyl hydrolase family 28-related protein [Primorskyibacter sp. S187A]|uniref:glycosyl hydrolase family 28-related protein n=1 Tax=Primorskyibacter sp. S187A TaxID=3415130 RepID=UPI003C7D418D